jgi:WD40 repeat protein
LVPQPEHLKWVWRGLQLAGQGVNAVAAGTLPDGTPVIISGGEDGTVWVWRTADGTPVGEPLTGHDSTCCP